jgi:HAD superfamily hydrolase (TIGR01549 family)
MRRNRRKPRANSPPKPCNLLEPPSPTTANAVLLDWGETLVSVPSMVHSPERHIACLEQLFFGTMRPEIGRAIRNLTWPRFRDAYVRAARECMDASHRTRREHRFAERFLRTLQIIDGQDARSGPNMEKWAEKFGELIVRDAELVDGAGDVVPRLAGEMRLGIVSNYPHSPVVRATLSRFGLAQYFSVIAVSADLGWLKPCPEIYRFALAELGAAASTTWFVGDDLENDIRGPKALGFRTAWIVAGCRGEHSDADIIVPDLRAFSEHLKADSIRSS